MIFIVYGTTAEYIKIFPLIEELKARGTCFTIALSQHEVQLRELFDAYPNLPRPDLWLVKGFRGRDLDAFHQVPIWFAKVAWAMATSWREVRRAAHPNRARNAWLVHGDTFTTVLGALWGRMLGYRVGHVEAGLRSHSLAHPMPEEIDRILVTAMADMHFAPGQTAVENLAGARGEIVDTVVNTSFDSIQVALSQDGAPPVPDLPPDFGIISLHRTEWVANRDVFAQTLRTLAEYGARQPMIFLNQPVTIARAEAMGLGALVRENFLCLRKVDYFNFIRLLNRASYVITDSGGLQEDCAYLRKPCLVIRKATERSDGLAEGITMLSHWNDESLRAFLTRRPTIAPRSSNELPAPTAIIIDHLERAGFV